MKYRGKHTKQASSVKSTKRALIASAVCTVLCGLLLFSTSVAWFTATKESKVNELYSGNLDVEFQYSKTMDRDWKDVENADDIFKVKGLNEEQERNMLWEPGAVNVVYFRVKNMGSLAAEYDFTVDIEDETEGTNISNTQFKLSDYIKGGVVKDISAAYVADDTGRTQARTAVETDAKTLQEIHTDGTPLITDKLSGVPENSSTENSDDTTKTFALVLYMPDDTGVDTNYKTGTAKPTLKLKVKLVATQDVGENDSFGSEYDKGAHPDFTVKTVEKLNEALVNADSGDVIGIGGNDLELTDILNINIDVTIVGDSSAAIKKYPTYVGANNTVTFKNVKFDDTTSLEKATSVYGQGFKGTLIFDGCTFGQNKWEAIQITPASGCTIIINNCTFNGPQGAKRYIHIQPQGNLNNTCKLNVTVTNCTFNNCELIKYNQTEANYGSVIDFDYFAPNSTITMGMNQFKNTDGSEATGIKPFFCSTGDSGYPYAIEGGALLTYLKDPIHTYTVTASGLTN